MSSLPSLSLKSKTTKKQRKDYEQYELDINQYEKGSRIGGGAFGEVYQIEEKSTGKKYAAKIVNCGDDDNV